MVKQVAPPKAGPGGQYESISPKPPLPSAPVTQSTKVVVPKWVWALLIVTLAIAEPISKCIIPCQYNN